MNKQKLKVFQIPFVMTFKFWKIKVETALAQHDIKQCSVNHKQ